MRSLIPNQVALCVWNSDEQGGDVREPDVHDGVRLLLLRLLLQSINELLVRGEDKAACLHVADHLVGSVGLLRGIVALDGLCGGVVLGFRGDFRFVMRS